MLTLSDRFALLKERHEKALILFLTAGDQPLDELPAILEALVEGGADAIEIGIPFSDPFGEGPTIQASSQRALDRGVTAHQILAEAAKASAGVPLVTMGYYNPILRFGLSDFATASRDAGISGTIVSDLVPDEADDWCAACGQVGIDTIFLVAPTSTESRIDEVCARATGFVYAVSRTGVTGAENSVPTDVKALVQRIQAKTSQPVCVGFGISTPEHVRMVCEVADGAVVGSFLVNLLHREWNGGEGREKIVEAVRSLKRGTIHLSAQPASTCPKFS
ncbi:MAG: tryptophan synthase subunit alpha [Fimbriimonas sp.]|nr:tryptophan synthase subunit alpha [Fimbriimonas sp.]